MPYITGRNLRELKILDGDREPVTLQKPYFIGMKEGHGEPLPEFIWQYGEGDVRRTPLYETHLSLGAKMIPFAGWEMPVWYSSVLEEHIAVRESAGIFDVSPMGVYQAEG